MSNLTKEYDYCVTAAGRVNLIGEHVDYCGGKVLPLALSMKNTVYVRKNGTNTINIKWTTLPEDYQISLDIDKLREYKDIPYGNYQAGSAFVWRRAVHNLVGVDMLQDCKVPFGSGLSSSAAIEVSTIAALAVVADEKIDQVEIALLAQQAEREYVGMNCGIMDQYASACGKEGYAILLDCKTLDCEYIPADFGDYALVIMNTNKPHSLVVSEYNARRKETDEALAILQRKLPVTCLAEVSLDDFQKFGGLLNDNLYNRVKHVVEECDRVNQAVIALKSGDMRGLGNILNASHKSLKELYEVTGLELDTIVETAQSFSSCIGARMTGGGFGGSAIALVERENVEKFKQYVGEIYLRKIGYEASFYTAYSADGITVERVEKYKEGIPSPKKIQK